MLLEWTGLKALPDNVSNVSKMAGSELRDTLKNLAEGVLVENFIRRVPWGDDEHITEVESVVRRAAKVLKHSGVFQMIPKKSSQGRSRRGCPPRGPPMGDRV